MAERSTWPETHLNAVNKLLCWDASFPGKATRPAATGHIPTSCAVHLAVLRGRQVGNKKQPFGLRWEEKVWLSTTPSPHSSLSASPEATRKSVQFQNSHQPSAYQEALRAATCDADAVVPVIGGQKDERRSAFRCRARTKTKRSAIRQRSAPISTAVS